MGFHFFHQRHFHVVFHFLIMIDSFGFLFSQVIIPNSWHLYLVFFLIKWALLSGRHTWLQQGNPIAIKRHSAFMMRFSYLQIPVIVTCVSPTHLVHYKSLRLLFSLPWILLKWTKFGAEFKQKSIVGSILVCGTIFQIFNLEFYRLLM